MTTLSDARVFSQSMESQLTQEQFQSKQWSYVTDQNNSSYNGSISFDCSSISNNGRWVNWSESYFEIPYVMAFKSDTDLVARATAPDPHTLGFKSFLHLVDGMEIQMGNNTVQQQTPFSNMFNYYKVLSTWSADSLVKYGALVGISPDTARAYEYSAAVSKQGAGYLGNRLVNAANVALATTADITRNEGFKRRASYHLDLIKYPVQLGAVSAAAGGRHRWPVNPLVPDVNTIWYATGVAVIRLKDISDFIAKLPLVKGSFMKFTLTTNTGSQVIAAIKNASLGIVSAGLSLQGRCMPMMVGGSATSEPLAAANSVNATANFTVAVGIGSVTIGGVTTSASPLTSCRVYVPSYILEPSFEMQYLESFPTKEIVYNDLFNFVTPSVAQGGDIQFLLTNGIKAPQYLVVIPIADQTVNAATGIAPHQSVFSAEPNSPTAGSVITNFNVQISGTSLFQSDLNYDYEVYRHEVAAIGALNGGMDDELTSGLIDFDSWTFAYRYYVADLSRYGSADIQIPKSVMLMGRNAGNDAVSTRRYICFIAYQRRVTLRPIDSTIIASS